MKMIQTINDLEYLKASGPFPLTFVANVEKDFFMFYEAYGEEDELLTFSLPIYEALVITESHKEADAILGDGYMLEYIEEEEGYFKVGKMNAAQEINFVYIPFEILDESMKKALRLQSEFH